MVNRGAAQVPGRASLLPDDKIIVSGRLGNGRAIEVCPYHQIACGRTIQNPDGWSCILATTEDQHAGVGKRSGTLEGILCALEAYDKGAQVLIAARDCGDD